MISAKRTTTLLATVLACFSPLLAADTLVLSADHLLDAGRGTLVNDPVLVIRDGQIVDGAGEIPADARRLHLPGQTLLPGLIDMHVHLTSSPNHHGYERLSLSDERLAILGVMHAERTLNAGFTTVRNVGARSFGDVALRDAIAAGEVPGPRMFVAGRAVGMTGGHCSDNNLLPHEYGVTGGGVADGPWAIRAKVRENIKFGADLIKTCSTGGVLSKGTRVGAPQYTVEELRALVEEAHSQGMKVASHAHGAEGIRNALEAGVDTIEHASFIDDEGIRMAKRQGAWLSMDIYVTEYILGEGAAAGILEESLAKERMTGETQRANFRRAHEAGVKMVFGTDAGVFPHGQNARQFSRMTRYGMSPAEAIRTATTNAAEALGQANRLGSLAPGYSADVIAVPGNPLQDISLLENVTFVMKAGEIYRSTGSVEGASER